MNIRKLLCMVMAMLMALGAVALAETDDLQARLDEANARVAELEAEVELYKPYYDAQIVAEYGDGKIIWRDDAMSEYDSLAQTYAQYGMNLEDNPEIANQAKQGILEDLVQKAVLADKTAELGLDQLDDETLASLKEEASKTFDNYVTNYVEYYRESFEAQGVSEEEAREQITASLQQSGLTSDAVLEQVTESYLDEQLYNHVTADVGVSDEEVQAKYEAMVAEAQEDYTNDRTYNNALSNGDAVAWNPEGYRAVKHVLIKFDDAQSSRYSELKSTLDSLNAELEALDAPAEEAAEAEDAAEPEETTAPRSREEIQSDIGNIAAEIEALYSELLPKAQQVVDEFNGGADFDSLIEKYNEDPGMTREPTATNGYAVAAESTTWDTAFRDGAMSIEAVGQISEPVYGQNGIHIIYYLSDITPGEVPFEEIADAVKDAALKDKTAQTYNDQVAAWVDAANPVYHADRF